MRLPVDIRPAPPDAPAHAEAILRSLPDWFGLESPLVTYAAAAGTHPTFFVYASARPAGFLTLTEHFPESAEIHCIAVRAEHRGRGLGRALVAHAESRARSRGVRFLQVKTMGPSKPNEAYRQTTAFYRAVGFTPLEELKGFWDGLPCLILVKAL